ncbi:hypothetical protein TTRE_0000750501 [Trichuris trichiura]|uniref:Uncharacterized protein n=1 Tax=Trichuris trichiura TaxID=36087 RepID=A0A077ZKS1_TRITR|nr:hypothetical protein TTRE_0000750501 [Trichuris trichiura]
MISASEVKFTSRNSAKKVYWEFQKENVRLLLEFHHLLDVVDGTEKCPVYSEAKAIPAGIMNKLEKLKRKDMHAKLLITMNTEKDMRRKLGVVKTAGQKQ